MQVAAPDHCCVAYVDTVELFMRYVPRGARKEVDRALGRRCRFKTLKSKKGETVGRLVTVHQPNPAVLAVFARYEADHRATLARIDVAYDFLPTNIAATDQLREWLEQHVQLRRSRREPMFDEFDTVYWVWQRDRARRGKKRSRRDIALYSDRPSKVLEGRNCVVHLEVRFYGAPSLRSAGLGSLMALNNADPAALFARNIRLVDFIFERDAQQMLRDIADTYRDGNRRLRSCGRRFEVNVRQRTWGFVRRLSLHRVQGFRALYPKQTIRLKSLPMHTLNLPRELTQVFDVHAA